MFSHHITILKQLLQLLTMMILLVNSRTYFSMSHFFLALEFYCISFFITFAAEKDENNQYYESV